jgi:hypothetical protein
VWQRGLCGGGRSRGSWRRGGGRAGRWTGARRRWGAGWGRGQAGGRETWLGRRGPVSRGGLRIRRHSYQQPAVRQRMCGICFGRRFSPRHATLARLARFRVQFGKCWPSSTHPAIGAVDSALSLDEPDPDHCLHPAAPPSPASWLPCGRAITAHHPRGDTPCARAPILFAPKTGTRRRTSSRVFSCSSRIVTTPRGPASCRRSCCASSSIGLYFSASRSSPCLPHPRHR